MSLGPAGTGKSFLAVSVAVTLLMEKKLTELFYLTCGRSWRKTRFFTEVT